MISASFQPNTRLYGVRVPSLPLGPRLRSFVDIFLVTREVEGQRELGVAARLRAPVVFFALVERDVPLQTKLPGLKARLSKILLQGNLFAPKQA